MSYIKLHKVIVKKTNKKPKEGIIYLAYTNELKRFCRYA